MPLGFDKENVVVNIGDTADLYARLYDKDDKPVTADQLVSVSFTVQHPDLTQDTTAGQVQGDGTGYLLYRTTTLVGHYPVVAQFTLVSGAVQSARTDFEVISPFSPSLPASQITSPGLAIRQGVWHKIQDCFDAEDEGPWLRDMTQNFFAKEKFSDFIDEALFDINQQNPPTTESVGDFVMPDGTPTGDFALLVQGTFLGVLRQMMRSYVEQPFVQNGQVAYEDRRDYLTRWKTIYDLESQLYMRWLALWKRQFLAWHAKGLLSSKAGRLIPAPMRTRNVGRGYWTAVPVPVLYFLAHLLHNLS